jgi:hypothetical protein
MDSSEPPAAFLRVWLFFGAFQLSAYAALAMFFPLAEITSAGAAFVFLLYVVQIGGLILLGAVALVADHVSPREVLGAGEATSSL